MTLQHCSLLSALLIALSLVQTGCQKEEISPALQEEAFVKYFGYIENQAASDLKRTADGGYLILGTTNSFSTEGRNDMYLVKTDSLGNEVWSQMYGSPSSGTNGTNTYDEEGVKIVVLPDASGYLIAGNRTEYVNDVQGQSKVVLYQLDLEGAVVNGPVVLRNSSAESNFSERITDIIYHQDTVTGINSYVLTGQTTNIKTNKPGGIKATDEIDMLIMRIDENFSSLWSQGVLAYGFDGNDFGYSVHVVDNNYLLVGTDQQSSNDFNSNIRTVIFRGINGAVENTKDFGGTDFSFGGGYSQIDYTNQLVTIVAHQEQNTGNSTFRDDLMMMQIDFNLNTVTPNPHNGNYGFRFYGPNYGNINGYNQSSASDGNNPIGSWNNLEASSLALITANDGYVVAFTNNRATFDTEIGILKVNSNLEIEEGWPYTFGFQDPTGLDGTLETAGTVIPSVEQISGTNQTRVTGYVFTGTFGLGTNPMMGLVKINERGTLEPE